MKYYMIAFLFLFSFAASAQDDKSKDENRERMNRFLNKIDGEKPKETSPLPSGKKEGATLFVDTAKIAVKSFPDVSDYYSECYAKVVNQYGFWKGVGPKLNKDDIRHMWRYVKLMRPKGQPSSAPFTLMQVLTPFGNLGNNSYGPVLANPFGNDQGISSTWKKKLMNICQFEKISSNGVVIQENMYDEEGKLVLQYFPTSVSKNQVVGHYTDAYGTLAKLRKDEDCTYVGITLDENGYESQIAFMDTKGQLKRNGDDAFVQLIKHDASGNVIQFMSADAVGDPIIDNCGNCGWQYTFDKRGNDTTATCINQYGQPQRMKKIRDNDTEDCVRIRYSYDKWGNILTKTFYDENWKPDTITGGIHRYVYTHSLYGNTTSMRAEGLDGHLVPSKAQWHQILDKQGNRLYYVQRDSKGRFWTSEDYCMAKAGYKNGEKMWEERYTSTNGVDSVLSYRYVRTPYCDSTFNYTSKYINIERYDSQRNLVSDEYFDFEGRPVQSHLFDYHKRTINRIKNNNRTITEYRYFDEHNLPRPLKGFWKKYNVNVITKDKNNKTYSDFQYDGRQLVSSTEVDSVKRQKIVTEYSDGRVVDKYAFDLSEDCKNVLSLLYFDSLGCRGRTFKANALYYNARKYLNVQGNNIAWRGINEFGEPSYILNGDWDNATLYCTNVVGDEYYYNEKGDTIPRYAKERKEFKDTLYKSLCIELIDSVALKLGLRTGDVIVRYGNWQYPVPSVYGRYQESLLCLESIKKALNKKTMVVMRHDGATKTSKLIELDLPIGTPKQLGFIYHMLYMTEKEQKRYETVIRKFRSHVDLDSLNSEEKSNDKVNFIMPYKVGDTADKKVFMKGFNENAIIVAWEPHVKGQTYLFTCNSKIFDQAFVNEYDSITLHYTVDGKNIKRYTFQANDFTCVRRSFTKIGDATEIYALADSLQRTFDAVHPHEKIVLTPHKAVSRLLQLKGTKEYSDDGEKFRGIGNNKYGNVTKRYGVKVDYDSLTYNDKFLAYNILSSIDYGDYYCLVNDSDWVYCHKGKDKFDEIVWHGNDYIVFLSGDMDFYNKHAIIMEVIDNGLFRERGLNGKYLLLQCNGWRFGKHGGDRLRKEMRIQDFRQIVMTEILDKENGFTLGPTIKQQFPTGKLGIQWRWNAISDDAYFDALKRSKR